MSLSVAFTGRIGAKAESFALDAAFDAPEVGFIGLFGPSGCGKSSLLRAIAGLDRHAQGRCALGDEIWQEGRAFTPAHKRPIGYVFQEPSLFSHLSIVDNLTFATRGRRPRRPQDRIGFDETVTLLGLEPLLARAPRHLSGGERQRVAIGRALLSQPRLLLMDEPVSALDQAAKDEILPYLERLHATLALPALYVSHDISEIERLCDHLVLMETGRVIAAGPLAALQSDIALPLAAGRDAAVSLQAVVQAYDARYGLATFAVDGGAFLAPIPAGVEIGAHRRLTISAGDVSLARQKPIATTALNVLPARIRSARALGAFEMIVALGLGPEGGGATLLARVTRRSWDELALAEGMAVYAQAKGVALARKAIA